MKRLPLLMILVLLPIKGVLAGDLRIGGETKVAPYRLVRLYPIDAPPDAAVIWDVYPEEKADIQEEKGGRLFFVAPPGTYRIKLRTIKGIEVQTARETITIGKADPLPPEPDPDDPAPPKPSGPLTILVVEETADRTAQRAAMFANAELRARIAEKKHTWRLVDKDVIDKMTGLPPTDVAPWIARTAKTGLPALFLFAPDGTIFYEGKLPETAPALVELLKKNGG